MFLFGNLSGEMKYGFSQGSERCAGVVILKNDFSGVILYSENDPDSCYLLLIQYLILLILV